MSVANRGAYKPHYDTNTVVYFIIQIAHNSLLMHSGLLISSLQHFSHRFPLPVFEQAHAVGPYGRFAHQLAVGRIDLM